MAFLFPYFWVFESVPKLHFEQTENNNHELMGQLLSIETNLHIS